MAGWKIVLPKAHKGINFRPNYVHLVFISELMIWWLVWGSTYTAQKDKLYKVISRDKQSVRQLWKTIVQMLVIIPIHDNKFMVNDTYDHYAYEDNWFYVL